MLELSFEGYSTSHKGVLGKLHEGGQELDELEEQLGELVEDSLGLGESVLGLGEFVLVLASGGDRVSGRSILVLSFQSAVARFFRRPWQVEEEENEEVEEEASKDETEIQVDERKLVF
uniref:Uncharacterized protein n=1 Tax=Lactuca sativa TaxID=4236 RepID=A0A9R1UCN8_LACSA|nr:hypothetical protein LSAT_V11C900462730 [Lactuca sativa]